MSDLRNIKRTFCFGRALAKFNKKSFVKVIPSHVYVLYALFDEKQPCTVQELQQCLKRNKHHYSTTVIKQHLTKFVVEGWLHAPAAYPSRYSMTLEGRNALNEIERRLRNERSDK